MAQHKTTCKEVMRYICDNLGEDLDSQKCVAIKEHLDNCGSCQKYFKTVDLTIQLYQKYEVKVTDKTHKNLMEFLGLDDCEE